MVLPGAGTYLLELTEADWADLAIHPDVEAIVEAADDAVAQLLAALLDD
jgi:hypothetical protein